MERHLVRGREDLLYCQDTPPPKAIHRFNAALIKVPMPFSGRKWIKDLNVIVETRKLLEEYQGFPAALAGE